MSAGTQPKQVRIPDDEWDQFKAIASERGSNASTLIRNYVRRTIARHTPKDPK